METWFPASLNSRDSSNSNVLGKNVFSITIQLTELKKDTKIKQWKIASWRPTGWSPVAESPRGLPNIYSQSLKAFLLQLCKKILSAKKSFVFRRSVPPLQIKYSSSGNIDDMEHVGTSAF